MEDSNINLVRAAAERMGGSDPKWLRERRIPDYETVEQGEAGPVLVFLHGLFGALSNWDTAQPCIAEKVKTIALKFPLLSCHRSEVKVKALAAFTELFIRERKLNPVTLCGNSLGGHVALRVALASPDLIDCLILSGSSGLYEHQPDSMPVHPNEEFVRTQMKRVFYNSDFIKDEAVAEMLGIFGRRMNHLNLIHAARSAKRDNLKDLLGQVSVPTLLIWGEDDEVTTLQVARLFNESIPNSKLVTIKDCGHAPMIEHPKWFSEQVHLFLQEHSAFYARRQ